LTELIVAALQLLYTGVIDKAADEQVEFAIGVVVEPDGAGSPTGRGKPGLFGDVGKCSVVIIFVENAFAVCGDKEIGPAVVVVVQKGATRAERLGQIVARRYRVLVYPSDAARRRWHLREQWLLGEGLLPAHELGGTEHRSEPYPLTSGEIHGVTVRSSVPRTR